MSNSFPPKPPRAATCSTILRPLAQRCKWENSLLSGSSASSLEVQKFSTRPRPVGQKARVGSLAVREPLPRDLVVGQVFLEHVFRNLVNAKRVASEDLRAESRRDPLVAVLVGELRGDLEAAEGLDLILGRAVPDRIRTPEHVVLPHVLDELAERMGRRIRIAHEEPPGRPQLGIDV